MAKYYSPPKTDYLVARAEVVHFLGEILVCCCLLYYNTEDDHKCSPAACESLSQQTEDKVWE